MKNSQNDELTRHATAKPAPQAAGVEAWHVLSVILTGERVCEVACPSNQPPTDVCEDAIRALAHSKWEAAGCPAGDGLDFWLEAEREVNAERTGSSSAQG